jgi:tRNA dimethylallyltransferase
MSELPIYVVQGPTASGKTALAITLAQQLQTEIISFDSRQFYKELAIGVARPSEAEQAAVKHHFIASHSIEEPLNAAQFAACARPVLDQLLESRGSAVLVGGSAMFADALLLGLDPLPHDPTLQLKWQNVFKNEGLQALQMALQKNDLAFFEQVDRENPVRLIRALEIVELTGQSNTVLRKGPRQDPEGVTRIYLDWPRAELYDRIDQRVDLMIAEGLETEAQRFYPQQSHLQSLQTVGYTEFFHFFSGHISRAEAVAQIKQHTRNYAKRQLTWLGRYANTLALDPKIDTQQLVNAILKIG